MTWLAVLKALLQLSNMVLAYVQQSQLISAGEAKEIARNLDTSLNLLGVMDKARSDAVARFDADNGVHDKPDPYRRD